MKPSDDDGLLLGWLALQEWDHQNRFGAHVWAAILQPVTYESFDPRKPSKLVAGSHVSCEAISSHEILCIDPS